MPENSQIQYKVSGNMYYTVT